MKSSNLQNNQILSNVIAVIGCDGSGKSTLTADLLAQLQSHAPVELLYLGQSSGNIGDWIKSRPLIGPSLNRYLKNKAKGAHSKESKSPDTATTIVIYLLSLWRAHKFRRMLSLTRKGTLVITDRYPQAETAGFYFDGTGLGGLNHDSWLVRKLAAREQKLYEWMASHIPTLVIRLNIDAQTAYDRKPDHKLKMLEAKVSVIPTLTFNGADILDLDGTSPYQQVLETALTSINQKVNP